MDLWLVLVLISVFFKSVRPSAVFCTVAFSSQSLRRFGKFVLACSAPTYLHLPSRSPYTFPQGLRSAAASHYNNAPSLLLFFSS